MSCFGSRFLLAKPAGCKVAGCVHPHPFAQVHQLMIHRLQRQVQKRRTSDEILIFAGIPPIYTRGIHKPLVFSIIVFSKIFLQKRNPIVKHKSTTFHTIHTTMLSVHISHWLMTVLIAVSYSTGGHLNFFSKCFTILRILARAVSFFCRSITLALLNFCVSSHLHCSVRLTQVELSADTANTTGGSGNRAARCVRL